MAISMIAIPFFLFAQTETFDIVTYQPPPNWKKQTTDFNVSFSTVDNGAGTWAQVAIYSSVQSSGDPAKDFSSEWKALVKPETYAGATEPAAKTYMKDGWTHNVGTSIFTWQGRQSFISILNISGYGVMVSVLASGTPATYEAEVGAFLNSLSLKKPEQQVQPVSNPQAATIAPAATTNTPAITVTSAPGRSGIALSTTNFDDGWVAQPFADYVMITKPGINVLLHYAIQIDDHMRSFDNMAAPLWDQMIVPRYRVSNVIVFQNEPYTYNKVYFIEADAVELSTNKPCHVALRVLVWNGIARGIEIIAPSADAMRKEFPDQSKIESMINYNKFAVSPEDIIGRWEESSSTAINMYNVNTGQYAGMNTSASAHSFDFKTGSAYNSNHKGAYGMTGSMQFFDQKYQGKYTLTNWDVTLTNRFEGKTEVFWCQYEAVRGGRVLHLTEKNASAMKYSLVKVN